MNAKLSLTRGVLSVTGSLVDQLAQNALNGANDLLTSIQRINDFHITVVTKEEYRKLPANVRKAPLPQQDFSRVYSAGIGGMSDKGVYFVVIIWAAGQQLRRGLGLPPKNFHITLSEHDDHEIQKGISSLFFGQFPSDPSPDFYDHLVYTLHLFSDYRSELSYSLELVKTSPDSHKGFVRAGDVAFALEEFKFAMLAYACAFQRTDQEPIRRYCIRKMVECSANTEWGNLFLEVEKTQLPDSLLVPLLSPWSSALRQALSSHTEMIPTLTLGSREPLYLGSLSRNGLIFHRLPRFFRWLVPFHFAIMSTPRCEEDISFLTSMGIRCVLTLTEEEPLPQAWFTNKPIMNVFHPVSNFYAPSIEQMALILRLFEDIANLPLLVHCGGGKGRAGTVAACYIAAYGFGLPKPRQEHPEMSATDAIAALRLIRPGSLETEEQEDFVSRWCSTIWKRQAILPEIPSEPPPWPLEVEGRLSTDDDLLILVGLPASGKSWLSQALIKRDPLGWSYISQDELGSRALCEITMGRHPTSKRTILDRCNTSSQDRKSWLELASSWSKSPVCVWFDYDRVLCLSRAQQRVGHPTLPPGNRVCHAVAQMHDQFRRPTLEEGFSAIVIIRSFSAIDELVETLSPSTTILKFPRTPHLIDVGGATSDDIVLNTGTTTIPGHVVITEKVDGANMGFSLSAERKLLVQNRSHYVNDMTHVQFKKLGLWMETHQADLLKVLNRDEHFPERFILYGEWLYAKHSIPYTRLPDIFMAYDLYDRVTSTFADRPTLMSLLTDTKIMVVPVMHEGSMPSENALKEMIQRDSDFWDGRVEGVYMKVEGNGHVVSRSKVVRSDFIVGNDHWSKGKLQINGFLPLNYS